MPKIEASTTTICINDDMRILCRTAEYTIQLRKVTKDGKTPGKEVWDSVAHHGRLGHALTRSIDFLVGDSKEAMTIKELQAKLEQWQEHIEKVAT